MNAADVENLFFRPAPSTAAEHEANRRHPAARFRPVPPRNLPSYRMPLSAVLPTRTQAIQNAGRLIFHTMGDTGGINGIGAQENVAGHMTRQIQSATFPDQPSFLYHLGDVVYYNGENSAYHDQFYHPYQDYPAPIFAIPGNHDGDTLDPANSLVPFMAHFCSAEAHHADEAGHSLRPTMTQPNFYWRLDAPFLTLVGLYSNVSGELDDTHAGATTQRDWLTVELRDAPSGRALILAVHHPLFSLGSHGGTDLVRRAINAAIDASGRIPDLILTGHEHCYQRFTWKRHDRHIPVLVVGAGGFATYNDMTPVDTSREPPAGVTLKAHDDTRPGFLRMIVNPTHVTGEYFTVPGPGQEADPETRRDAFSLDLQQHRLD